MQFSLKVVCNRKNTEYVRQHVAVLSDYLGLSDALAFSPYWKDHECVVLELHSYIENFDASSIQKHIVSIGGTEKVSIRESSDEWECGNFTSLHDLYANKYIAFVVCSVWQK